ncbi:4-methylaminobutanoate oxidase (formaldehyde-forming) [Mycoplana sp. BE70]|uniref:GcvT family protein n=1 Tax=Mycoplana sp. BE70 TaxID=2817775 RepID=UPI00285CAA5F|nr:FAD-dependent oxidoreductase [Mycoplana sp. BE70]MDR6756860.1 4-methylaminobutanoate oxidase (formaldehyde-forming) [Mycoplana sp. BE70]
MASEFPDRAEAVIVGGGVAGCSVAYHLTKLGITDVVLCERKQLTSGTTWHAAGLVTQLRATRRMTELAKYTGELFGELEAETGQATGFKRNGSLRVANTPARYEELARGASMGRNFGLPVEAVTPGDIKERWDPISTEGIVGGFWFPHDGQVNPADVTQAYARGARMRGARIFENTGVTKILVENGKAAGVMTDKGLIRAKTVVLCGGMWSRDLAAEAGVTIPLHAAEHFYIVTEPVAGLPRNLPVLFLGDEWTYYKEDAGKLLVGFFEPNAKPWGQKGISEDFCFGTLPEDIEHIAPYLDMATRRVPVLERTGIQLFFNGPESFTPDDRYLLGETPEVPGLFCATGFNSIGILSSGGVGKALADWIRDRRPPMELMDVDVRRMQAFQSNRKYLEDRTTETLGLLFDMHWPNRQFETARGVRRSPFHDRLAAMGAFMTEAAGWERPGFFGAPGTVPSIGYSYGRQSWFDTCGEECRNTAENVTLFDHSCFIKYLIEGRDAQRALNRICANDIDVPPGRVVYTQWLNEVGGIEADVTVTRLSESAFLVVTIAVSQRRDMAWLKRQMPGDAHVFVQDVTSGMPMLALMGPKSRALLEKLTPADLSDAGFPFGTSREIDLGYARVRASRLTYVGELGWELYMPAEFAGHVFEKLAEAGEGLGLKMGGFFAINSLRMEKGYRHWGHDIGEEDTPLQAGLGFAVAFDKPGGFIGREALLRQRERGPVERRLVQLRLETDGIPPHLYHNEPILRDGEIVGSVTSGAYGHRIGASLGMGYVTRPGGFDAEWLETGHWQVEIAWKRYPARLQLRPWYDPRGERLRG